MLSTCLDMPQDDLPYTDTPGVASSITLTADSLPAEFVHLLFKLLTSLLLRQTGTQNNFWTESEQNVTERKSRAHNWSPTHGFLTTPIRKRSPKDHFISDAFVEDYWSTNPLWPRRYSACKIIKIVMLCLLQTLFIRRPPLKLRPRVRSTSTWQGY